MDATPADAIDGVVPHAVVEPGSAEEVAAILAAASQERASVVIRGGGTKLGWGRRPAAIALVLSTKGLDRVVAHEYPDLTATVQAGARIDRVNAQLAQHGQCLPIESPFDGATIGGAIATNDSGPLRHRYGTPRDLLIGIRLALADGRLIKSGGNVVKNVAGYDLGKLMSGSFGSLAAIVSATFKLVPLPAASGTIVATFESSGHFFAAVAAFGASQLEAAAFEVHAAFGQAAPPSERYRLLLKFESTAQALRAHLDGARVLLDGARIDVVEKSAEADLWRRQTQSLWKASGMVVRAGWMPASLAAVLAFADKLSADGTHVELSGRAAIGSGLLRIDGGPAIELAAVDRMRARPDLFRHVVVLRAGDELKQQVDMWGSLGDAAALGAAVKHALDPHGILNAGRGPV